MKAEERNALKAGVKSQAGAPPEEDVPEIELNKSIDGEGKQEEENEEATPNDGETPAEGE